MPGQEPFAHNKSRDELRTVHQMEIDQRLQDAEQEMRSLTSRQLMHGGPDASSKHGRQERENEMGSMREQIRELRTQIEQLKAESVKLQSEKDHKDKDIPYYGFGRLG